MSSGRFYSSQMIRVAKRDNNKKRPYLIVNPLQGKHIPVTPSSAIHLFRQLADQLNGAGLSSHTVVISFAETATAIGACTAAHMMGSPMYLQTTRESYPEADYIYFSESHSHATVQKMIKGGLAEVLSRADDIVFIEDEITTGNTILGLKEALDQLLTKNVRYTAASLLNGMAETSIEKFQKEGIAVIYLEKSDNNTYESLLDNYQYDGLNYIAKTGDIDCHLEMSTYTGYRNPRWVLPVREYEKKCIEFAERFSSSRQVAEGERILVLGTEEFMYPALLAAYFLEERYPSARIKFHASTRSPILPSREKEYPLFSRYQLVSPYETDRITYLYNLEKYDRVFVMTETRIENSAGIAAIADALCSVGNSKIEICRWCEQ